MRIRSALWLSGGAALQAAALIVGATALSVQACNVPVFRYALERWPAGTAELLVFHRGALNGPESRIVEAMNETAQRTFANLAVETVDLGANPSDERQQTWQTQSNPPLPFAVLRLADAVAGQPSVWSGPISQLNGAGLPSSPGREELGRRLLNGDSAVWVLIESGNKEQDDLAATVLTTELRKLEQSLKLPPSSPDDPAPLSELPLKIAFSVQRVARSAAEDLFIRMMLHGETVAEGMPVVVPVFGRGRALTALSGAEISASIIHQAAAFLCGACSCEVKEMNPGKDLLMAVRWDSIFKSPEAAAATAATKSVAGERVEIAPGLAEAKPPAPIYPRPSAQRRGLKLLASTGLAFTAIVVLLVGIALLRSLRQR